MVSRAVDKIDLDKLQILVIENVGNLVCPATYDLGEDFRVALLSVTEGEDKPLKYPVLFKNVDMVLVTKIDISEAVGFDRTTALDNIRRVAPQAEILELSSRSGQGMDAWYARLEERVSLGNKQ
jgi:hydrogenase nickel incorporation protein HypB